MSRFLNSITCWLVRLLTSGGSRAHEGVVVVLLEGLRGGRSSRLRLVLVALATHMSFPVIYLLLAHTLLSLRGGGD